MSTQALPRKTFFRYTSDERIPQSVKIWLLTGLVMIFLQIFIGGVTRLTGSGLSITRWEIVTGTLPPLQAAQWEKEFALYQQTPQYLHINQGMTLPEFKFIYFWEYFHRLWARLMFFVFVVPFFWFLWRGMFSRRLLPRLLVVVALAGVEGFFGWIMVASGLIKRPWVNAYNLTLHLVLALVIFSYLLWTYLIALRPRPETVDRPTWRRLAWVTVGVTFIQLALGAMMSGTKAGLFYPTWPDQGGTFLPGILLRAAYWTTESFTQYDTNPFMPALLQFLHRNTAYVLTILAVWLLIRIRREARQIRPLRWSQWAVGSALAVQLVLGILTILNCKGHIPVTLGVLHQAGAVVFLGSMLYLTYYLNGGKVHTAEVVPS